MASISKAELKKEIAEILKDADLSATSAKKVRQQLEEKLGCSLQSRKKEIDDLVMKFASSKEKDEKENSEEASEEEEEEEEEEKEEEESEDDKRKKRGSTGKKAGPPAKKTKKGSESDASEPSDAESEEEYSPKKAKPIKTRKLPPKKKKGSESDSDEDWGKKNKKKGGAKGGGGGGRGYTKTMTLSPELAELVGQESMARHEVVKKVWSIIKERDLYDPKNKQYAICDDSLLKVIGVKRFRTFGMMKYLKNHFIS